MKTCIAYSSTGAEFRWRHVTLAEVCSWMQGKTVVNPSISAYPDGGDACTGIELSDGSQVVSTATVSGPYSEDTPDQDVELHFWIGTQRG